MTKSRGTAIRHALLITSIGILFTVPSFLSDFISGHNALTHLLWSKNFATQLWSGDLYPRWLMEMNAGFGSPAFFFYPPFSYYLTSLFFFPCGGDSFGWIQLGLSAAAALALSGGTAYLWLYRITENRSAALAGAICYMVLPYHLVVDLYYRFAFTEFWAFVWMPLILYFTIGICDDFKFAVPGFAISYSLLILTHLPTALIFSLVPFLYLFYQSKIESVPKNIIKIMAGITIGLAISSSYLLPAMMTQENVFIDCMTIGEFHYKNNFLFSSIARHPEESRPYLTFLSLTSLATFLFATLVFFNKSKQTPAVSDKEKKLWLFISIGATFMMLPFSDSLWEALPTLQRIQFPYRFNSILALSTAALVATAISSHGAAFRTHNHLVPAVILIFLVSHGALAGITVAKWTTGKWGEETKGTIARELRLAMEVPEYRPRWAQASLFQAIATGQKDDGPERVSTSEKSAHVFIENWQPRRIRLSAEAKESFSLVLGQLYYPGWTAILDDIAELEIWPSPDEGLVTIRVPEGRHRLVFFFRPGKAERFGQMATIAGILTVAGLLLWNVRMQSSPA